MSASPIVQIERLGKKYRLRHQRQRYVALRDVLADRTKGLARRLWTAARGQRSAAGSRGSEDFWALQDVSFEVGQGDVVGIIGRNGAGKSTLLKILSRITEPTNGRVTLEGRVGSLLEVGTGFHPELTGRENIFLNGAILGMTRAEIRKKFDEMVAFAEVERFLDTPVKHYSSGMYVRLAFAVAAHLEPEILVVDEVLAVGDVGFQKKCLGKMGEVARGGRTILFVSHNMPAVQNLCNRVLLLRAGRLEKDGAPAPVIASYLESSAVGATSRTWESPESAPGNEKIRIQRVAIVPETGDAASGIGMGTPFRIVVDYWNLCGDTRVIVNLGVYSIEGSPVLESLTLREAEWNGKPFPKGLFRSSCLFPGNLLNEGVYSIRFLFGCHDVVKLFDFAEALTLTIVDTQERNVAWYGRFLGYVHPQLTWHTERLEAPPATGERCPPA